MAEKTYGGHVLRDSGWVPADHAKPLPKPKKVKVEKVEEVADGAE